MVILALAALTMFLTSDWRLSLTALLVEYIAVGLVLSRFIQVEIAIAKILAGVFAVFMLYLAARRVQEVQPSLALRRNTPRLLGLQVSWGSGPLGLPLRLLAVLLVSLALVRLFGDYQLDLIPIDLAVVACWLGSMGLLGLALSGDPLRVSSALLTILVGFDLVFASLETDLAIVGFFAALTLMAALAFSYLITVHGLAQIEEPVPEEAES